MCDILLCRLMIVVLLTLNMYLPSGKLLRGNQLQLSISEKPVLKELNKISLLFLFENLGHKVDLFKVGKIVLQHQNVAPSLL